MAHSVVHTAAPQGGRSKGMLGMSLLERPFELFTFGVTVSNL
jgi:hypothetical protein